MTIPLQETLTCILPTALDAQLAQRAVRDETTKSQIVVAAVEAYLEPETSLERSLSSLEKKLFDRLLAIELRLGRMENSGRMESSGNSRHPSDQGTGRESRMPLVPIAVNPDDEDCYDEPDEILSDFALFAATPSFPLSSQP